MDTEIGRNDPCRCGSGKKYKKCCRDADEAARAAIRQFTGGHQGTTDEGWDPLAFDLSAIRKIRYERGFFATYYALVRGGGLEVTEWNAQDIPEDLLSVLKGERVHELNGRWGDPRTGTPIQSDIIQLESDDDDEVRIEIFNRGIALLATDDDGLRRVHRVCVALGRAAAAGSGVTSKSAPGSFRAPGDFDMEGLSRTHLACAGVCVLCGSVVGPDAMPTHLDRCAPEHDATAGPLTVIIRLHVSSLELPGYWLDLEMRQDAPLEALDRLLRDTWLECCGHLSVLSTQNADYFSRGYELQDGSPRARTMATRLGTALQDETPYFTYEYDFGSTTPLRIEVTGHRSGRLGHRRARLLARNEPPVWPCRVCGRAATAICASCRMDGVNAFACDAHTVSDPCGEDAALLPVVNSPRLGTCGYGAGPDAA